ncbi:MAG: L-2-hydroxyglutarate oxidase [Planctomycetota bacterium]
MIPTGATVTGDAPTKFFDLAVVGGGIVGLATAYRFQQRFPDATVAIVEKEPALAAHQTGHNSGVLHSGIYYKPGSLKAVNCRLGKKAMEAFCAEQDIPYENCGKAIVALDETELPALENIYSRGQENGVNCRMVDRDTLRELEPHAAGIQAIHVPESGIVDYKQVCLRLGELIRERGGEVWLGAAVSNIRTEKWGVVLQTAIGELQAKQVVNCAGLHSDRVAKLSGQDTGAKIIPFRGEYFELVPDAEHLVRNLIYPVPDPEFPFLGVHFTRMIHGGVECGPNAVLAWAREGYEKTDVDPRDLVESLTYPGFLKLAVKYWKIGAGEMWRSVSKRAFVKALARLLPDIREEHLKAVPAGVRAQAVTPDGAMVDDFHIAQTDRVVNVVNAPSPAATASLNIGELIVDRVQDRFK